MKYFYDTEFIEDGRTIELISIGIVCEDGREFYAQNLECDFSRASDWVKENVFPSLTNFDAETLKPIINAEAEGGYGDWYNRASIACVLRDQLVRASENGKPEFWGYYSAYDHVALCQLFGKMIDLPKGWPMYTRDIKQWCDSLGNPDLGVIPTEGHHNALNDARWTMRAYEFLSEFQAETTF